MISVISVREHGFLPVGQDGLTEPELEYLVTLRARAGSFFTEERVKGRWCCRFGGHAGAVSMPGGRTLEILPKVGDLDAPATRTLLMRMLASADIAPSIEGAAADYGDSPTLLEAYLRFATDLALQQVRMGLLHAYRRQDQQLPVIRGRLLIARQLARLPERFDAHLVCTDDLLADTPINRAIKFGIRWIAKVTNVTATLSKCRETILRMDAVTDTAGPPAALAEHIRRLVSSTRLDRRHARLLPLLRVLGLLLDDLGAAPEAGIDAPGPTLIFDMSKVFEALLATHLRRVLPDCSVDEQGSHRFDIAGRFMLRPDLVVRHRGQPKMVLDAKWKRIVTTADVADADIRQVFAYARILGVKEAALIFPRLDANAPFTHQVRVADGSDIRIHLFQVALTTPDWAALDADLNLLWGQAGLHA